LTNFWRKLRLLWPGWTIVAPLPFALHAVWTVEQGRFHWENVIILGLLAGLFITGPRAKKLFLGVYPVALVGLLYDSMRVVENVGVSPARVHLCDLRAHELALFGVSMDGGRATLHDWFQAHPSRALDALCAFPYATFVFVCVGFAVWLYFHDYGRMVRFAWCFLALNIAGFVTYHLYPAAPPWYYHAHGCAIDVMAHASAGPALARVDARLGIPYFAGMYGRSSDVFGAMPSLHVAYAFIVVLEGWAILRLPWRIASVAFFVLMFFSSVYLDHHWVLDGIGGMTYCAIVVAVARWVTRTSAPPAAASGIDGLAVVPGAASAPLLAEAEVLEEDGVGGAP
jgi:membrane-associated phospholipid phosphatase